MSRKIGVGVCLLVVRDRKLLIAERIGTFGRGFLACPGGHQEYGETWEQAALRELAEEAGPGLKVAVRPRLLPALPSESAVPAFVTNNLLPSSDVHYITVWLLGEWLAGEAVNVESDKKAGWTWMSLPEIMDDPRMRAGVAAWRRDAFHESLHWLPLPEIYRDRHQLGL